MTSILTNTAAMSALSSLTSTQSQLAKTQAKISSGLAIANASDNAAYWSISKTMSAQVAGLSAVQQSLSFTKSIADVTASALSSIKKSLDKMQADIVIAQQSGVDLSSVQSDISAQQQSIIAVADSASFNGINWLANRISTDVKITVEGSSSTPESEYVALGDGLRPGGSADYDLTTTETHTSTLNGVVSSTATTTVDHTTLSDAADGKPSEATLPSTHTTVGSDSQVAVINIPVSMSAANELITSSFSSAPIALYSEYSGSYERTTSASFAGVDEPTFASHEGPFVDTVTRSYQFGATGAFNGILDGLLYVPDSSGGGGGGGGGAGGGGGQSNGSSGSTGSGGASQPASSTTFSLSLTGGTLTPVTSGSGGGGGGGVSGGESSGGGGQWIQVSILTMSVVGASGATLEMFGRELQAAITGIISASTTVGALQTRISNMQTFDSSLSDALTSGIGSLVDADMNVASTRLQALQTQQQLGIQALSMANQNSQLILKLFQAA